MAYQAPAQRFAGAEGNDRAIALADALRDPEWLAAQPDLRLVGWQAIEGRTVERGEGFQPVERRLFLEHLGIDFEGARCGKDAGAAAGGFLCRSSVRRAVGAEKEPAVARGRGAAQRAAVFLSFGDRQAVEVRPDPAAEYRIPIDDQVMSAAKFAAALET